jgi:hypothetical protein
VIIVVGLVLIAAVGILFSCILSVRMTLSFLPPLLVSITWNQQQLPANHYFRYAL